jgi:hypothetical protein
MSSVVTALRSFVAGTGAIAVVKAPPGSGKTYTLVESLAAGITARRRVVIAAQTNNQVDEICERIAQRYPRQTVVRFSSSGYQRPDDIDERVLFIDKKASIPDGPIVMVATVAKLALSKFDGDFDILLVDEAWQMAWADFLPMRHVADRYVFIGDPGQIPPTVAIDVDRWEASAHPPHQATPTLILDNPALAGLRTELQLPTCRRLPYDSVRLVNGFYDFEFDSDAKPGERFIRPTRMVKAVGPAAEGVDLALESMWSTRHPSTTAVIQMPTPEGGLPVGTDVELARFTAAVVARLLERRCEVSTEADEKDAPRPLRPADIGVVSTHNLMNTAIQNELRALSPKFASIRVTTPERWQGLEKPVMVSVHPLSGVMSPSAFDLETGRLCVMASRHQSACFFVTRDHVSATLDDHLPLADQALGCHDAVGKGHALHRSFLDHHRERNLIV